MDKKTNTKVISNKVITHKYEIIDELEVGIELKGTEVKSLRLGKAILKDSFALIVNNEVILKNMHISSYAFGNINNVEEKRDRKLLLHKKEILKLSHETKENGYTLVPKKIYQKGRLFKVILCVCKGKKIYDKRDKIIQSEVKRQINYFKKD